MKFFALVWSNLKRKKLRTALTLLSIFIAFLLYGFLGAIRTSLAGGITLAGEDRLVVRHKVSIIQLLPEAYKNRMERIEGVDLAVYQTWFGGIYQDPKNFFPNMPVDPTEFLDMFPEIVLPEEQIEEWKRNRTGAIIGRTTADAYDLQVGDRIPLQSPIWQNKNGGNTWEFDIVGIFDGGESNTDTTPLYFRYDYFDEARAFGEGQVGWYSVRVSDSDRTAEIAAAIDAEFANSPAETKAEAEGAFVQGFAQQVGDIGAMVTAVLSAVFFTILLVAGNTMAQAVRERTEEIGVLKAMGFTDGLVMIVVLAESCLIAALGGLLGLGLAALIISGGSPMPGVLPIFYLPNSDLILGIVLVLGLGVVTGIVPAVQSMRLRISDALRRGG